MSKNKKKILVAVTGMSPQIVTETLYALYTQQQWLPQEIHVLTTQTGAANIAASLLGETGFFERLRREYGLPAIGFGTDFIHVIEDENGLPLADIRTPQENSLAADRIVRFIHDLCADDQTELHVSIAGGRKSMGFYIGYALSLFGRRQDRLSHVLVEEAFEQHREFFYPPRQSLWIDTVKGRMDAAEAKVMLADIPFVRIREGLPKLRLADDWRFSQAVAITQQSLSGFHLLIDCPSLSIVCGNMATIKLAEREFSFYLAMAEFKCEDVVLCREKNSPDYERLKERYWHHYCRFKKELRGGSGEAEKRRQAVYRALDIDEIWKEVPTRIKKVLSHHLDDYAQYYCIISSGERNRLCYQLAVDKKRIEICY
ncbi:CRISPR-associated ring nuclease Csm6 [Neisseria leonii]|uniref:CRISPR-associated ring nuclease Csm6 n=1 Tax=Neisseria leonii TaxID=2995413 RepID=A0A9X4DZK6_9NEIS|nr:CRISPR-associated ring nuclease Csm6 [Neisseria sp. 51.81]MDD9326778.1 CRISPR-associated ring nuclease Csm6 [Neisseria sp. 51.81]